MKKQKSVVLQSHCTEQPDSRHKNLVFVITKLFQQDSVGVNFIISKVEKIA